MRSISLALHAAAALAVIVPVFASPTALACSYSQCFNPELAGGSSPTVPVNAPAVPFDLDLIGGNGALEEAVDGGVQLFDATGNAVAVSVEQDPARYGVVLVRGDLEAGASYVLRSSGPCGEFEDTLHTSDSPPLPTLLGTVSVVEHGVGLVDAATTCGSCIRPIAAAFARLEIVPSAELAPFLPVTRFEVAVDGQRWTGSGYGHVDANGVVRGPRIASRRIDQVFAACRPSSGWMEDNGVAPGPHTVLVEGYLAGATEPFAAASVEVNLDCTGSELLDAPASCHEEDQPPRVPYCGGLVAVVAPVAGALAARRRRRRS